MVSSCLVSLVVLVGTLQVPSQDFYQTKANLAAGIEVSCALIPDSTWVDGTAVSVSIANTSDARWSHFFRYQAFITFLREPSPQRKYPSNDDYDYMVRGPCGSPELSLARDLGGDSGPRTRPPEGYERVTLEARREHVVEVLAPLSSGPYGVAYLVVFVFCAMETGGGAAVSMRLPLEPR